jgi:aryl-alcohol dehydrogenase-like predicted oxidoreductase
LEQRTIGGFKVSVLGLGTSRLASLGAGRSLPDVRRLLDAAADLGVTFIDTADTYGSTQCERWLGEALRGHGERFVVATKCGLPTVDLPRPFRALNQPAKKIIQRFGPQHYLDPAHIRRSIDSSLGRLHRERLELYFIHQPPVGVENMDDVFEALDQARSAGKIGAYGVCSQDPDIIRATVSVGRCEVVQTGVDPLGTPRLTATLASAPTRARVEVVANNVLTGLRRPPVVGAAEGTRAAADLGENLEALSTERGVSKAHLLVRHAAAVTNVRVVLTGTSNPVHLAENVAALNLPVTQEDLLS